MREIKFRVWDKKRKFLEDLSWPWAVLDSKVYDLRDGTEWRNIILMQSTGLKDKKGQDIYEGDIVHHDDYPFLKGGGVSTVRWDTEACGFYPFVEDVDEYGRPQAGEWVEVIGNIYESGSS